MSILPQVLRLVVDTDKMSSIDSLGLSWKGVAQWLSIGLAQGYTFAWIGHFFVERNRPAAFKVSAKCSCHALDIIIETSSIRFSR